MRRRHNPVRVWKLVGFWMWECGRDSCRIASDKYWSGASAFWEIAQRAADEHAREWHRPAMTHDLPTPPPGAQVFDWSDTGMHVKVRDV